MGADFCTDPESVRPSQRSGLAFGSEYYANRFGPIPYERNAHWLSFFDGIARELIRSLNPRRVFDAGCAWGFLVEAFWERGVEAQGADISEYAIGKVRPDIARNCRVASLADPLPDGFFDLVTCIEVLEHMPAEEAVAAIGNLTQATNCILFSSTPDDFTEPTHINVRPPLYWLKLFAGQGFYPDLSFDASFVAPHTMLLRRSIAGLPEAAISLFCEVLRHRADRAAFLNRHLLVESLETENARLTGLVRELNRELNQEKDQAREAGTKFLERLSDLEARLGGARHHEDWLSKELEASIASRRKIEETVATTRRELSAAQFDAEGAKSTSGAWEAKASALAQTVDRISDERDALLHHIDTIRASPGWRFVERYRGWLARRRRSRWVNLIWEPAARWALRRTGDSAGLILAERSKDPPPVTQIQPEYAKIEPPAPEPALAAVPPDQAGYAAWIAASEAALMDDVLQRELSSHFSYRPKISILVPVYRVPLEVLRETVRSVMAQTYSNWELCVAMANMEDLESVAYLDGAARHDSRIRLIKLAANEGISGNTNRALEHATGEFVALLDHDDLLTKPALFEITLLLNQDRSANFIYSDKDQITEDGSERLQPLFKPQWSPDLMLNANYLTHLCVMRTEQVRAVGGWRPETDGAQDWDIFLRVIHGFGGVRHIPKILYHWRRIATSVASGGLQAKPYAALGQVRTVTDHLTRLGLRGCGVRHEQDLRVEWPAVNETISVIYLSAGGDQAALEQAAAVANLTDHPSFEMLVPVWGGEGRGSVRAIVTPSGVSLRERIELAVKASSGAMLVLLDESAKPEDSNWLREMTGPLRLPGVSVVGARLNDTRTNAIRHCGIVFTPDGRYEYIYKGYPNHVFEAFGTASWYRNWSAVAGACLAIHTKSWAEAFEPDTPLLHPRLDLHLSLKLGFEKGGRVFYNPYARFQQAGDSLIESSPSEQSSAVADFLRVTFAEGDPYFNPNLDCRAGKVTYRIPERGGRRPTGTDYSAEAQILVELFDCSLDKIAQSQRRVAAAGRPLNSITWFLPGFDNPFYGGIHTLLRFADAFRRRHGIHSNFAVLARTTEAAMRRRIAAAFPDLASSSGLFIVDGQAQLRKIPPTDAAVSSLWTTAYTALGYEQSIRQFYFIQDDEKLFYPAGSISALVDATLGFGFHGLCNSPPLLDRYRARGGEGEYFLPCVDQEIFHDRGRKPVSSGPPYTLFCYARPNHPRNCFELLSSTLAKLKDRFGTDLTIVTAGADWDLHAYGLERIVRHLGLLSYQATGALYRMCDAGIVMMMTRHPSYLPLELMGCGSLVVTNRNPDTAWLLRDEQNCLLAAPTPTILAERVEEGLRNHELRKRIVADARQMVEAEYRDWDTQTEKILNYMRSR